MQADVLLLTSVPSDPHVTAVGQALARLDARTSVFDPGDFPSSARLQLRPECSSVRLTTREGPIELTQLKGLWWFRAAGPRSELDQPADRAWAEEQAQVALDSVWEQLDCQVVPGLRRVAQSAELKPRQLSLAVELGLTVPATLITNEPDDLLRFYEEQGGQVVAKVLRKPRIARSEQDVRLAYTHVVQRRDLLSFGGLAQAPIILQAYVPKQVELRLTIVGDRVFAACLHTQASELTRHDSRHVDASMRIEPHTLDSQVSARCVALVKRLGLSFGTLDLIITPEGDHVFLEVNPAGRFRWIEERTGLPISDALAALLLSPRKSGSAR